VANFGHEGTKDIFQEMVPFNLLYDDEAASGSRNLIFPKISAS
jgi:hypothetical protein